MFGSARHPPLAERALSRTKFAEIMGVWYFDGAGVIGRFMGKRVSARDRICNATLDLMESHPFQEITVTDIARQAGVSRTIFYRNYDSIFAVLQSLEDAYLELFPSEGTAVFTFLDMSQRGSEDGPYATSEYSRTVSENLRMYRILTGPNGDPSFEARMRNRVRRITHQTLESRLGQGRPEVELMTEYLANAQLSALKWWANHEGEVDAEATSRLIATLNANAMQSLVAAEGRLGIDIRAKDA